MTSERVGSGLALDIDALNSVLKYALTHIHRQAHTHRDHAGTRHILIRTYAKSLSDPWENSLALCQVCGLYSALTMRVFALAVTGLQHYIKKSPGRTLTHGSWADEA